MTQSWDDWLKAHLEVCSICKDSFEGSGEQGMCEVVFTEFQKRLREEKEEIERDKT